MEDFITKGGQTYLRHYSLIEIALALVCSSRPSSAVKIKSTVMFEEIILKFYVMR